MTIKIKKLNKKRGFTLVEMLIGVLIFSISLVALMTISSRGLKAARNAEKQVIADYLGIEALEVVRNMRDGAFLKNLGNSSWDLVFEGGDFLSDEGCFNGPNYCNFYFEPGGEKPLMDVCTQCYVFVDEDNYYYYQTQGDNTEGNTTSGFHRKISIREISEGQVFVLVRVTWDGGEVEFSENLFLWQ